MMFLHAFRMVGVLICLFSCFTFAAPLKFIQLKSVVSSNFVTVYWPDGAVRVDSVPYTHASSFEVHVVGESQWQLRAVKNNLYLSADDKTCVANRNDASGWETFNISLNVDDNEVQLQSHTGNWLGVDGTDSSTLMNTATSPGKAETFQMVEVPQLRAVNLGSWFVPEKWMFAEDSSLWANTSTSVVDLWTLCSELGEEESSRRMHQHWESWFTEADFARMAAEGVNHVRLPMGYWDVLETAPYVYGGAAYIDLAVGWAAKYGMTVMVDLHGAPGSQNGQDHSGKSGEILWSEPDNVALTVEVLGLMAKRWAKAPSVWGFELMNEPHYSLSHELLTDFYREGYAAIRKYSEDTHVVICSLYGPHDWTGGVLPEPEYRNAVLDLHLYTVWSGFTEEHQYYDEAAAWASQIRELSPLYPVVVGEMSLATAMVPYSAEQRARFATAEFNSFEDNAMGFVFWSDKLGYDSEDWSFEGGYSYIQQYYQMTDTGSASASGTDSGVF